MGFRVIGEIYGVETIASGTGIRDLKRIVKNYGKGRWHKRKGTCRIELGDGAIFAAEVHWYEAHGIGKKEMKIKYLLREERI